MKNNFDNLSFTKESGEEGGVTKEKVDMLFAQHPEEVYRALGLKDGTVDPFDVTGNMTSVMSIVEGKRDLGYIAKPTEQILDEIKEKGLHVLDAGIDPDGYKKYVIYKDNKDNAEIVAAISKKHEGYLPVDTSVEELITISNLLNYTMESTMAFLKNENREEEVKRLYVEKMRGNKRG